MRVAEISFDYVIYYDDGDVEPLMSRGMALYKAEKFGGTVYDKNGEEVTA